MASRPGLIRVSQSPGLHWVTHRFPIPVDQQRGFHAPIGPDSSLVPLLGFRTGILNLEALYLLYGFLGKGFIVLSEVNACENAVIIVKQFRQIDSSCYGNMRMNHRVTTLPLERGQR